MSTTPAAPRLRGVDHSLSTCGDIQCHGRGLCVIPAGGGTSLVCDCELGYRGEFCEDTVNEAIGLPLTLGVLGVIVGLIIVAFIAAKIRQKQKLRRRKDAAAARQGYNVAV